MKNVEFNLTMGDFAHPDFYEIGDKRPYGFFSAAKAALSPGYWIRFWDFKGQNRRVLLPLKIAKKRFLRLHFSEIAFIKETSDHR